LTLPNDQVPAVRVARLHLEQAQANSPNSAKGTFDVRAPRDGRVAEIKVEVGSRVEPGMVLLVLQ